MPNTTTYQCPNCCRWFNTPRSLKLHIASCQVKHFGDGNISKNDNHLPLKSVEGNRKVSKYDSQMNEIIRNGFMPHIMGHKLSHNYAREVRWNFEFDSRYLSKICLCLSKKNLHSLYLLFLIMSTLKGDVLVKIFHFTNFLFWPYVKKGEYCIEFVCRNVIF